MNKRPLKWLFATSKPQFIKLITLILVNAIFSVLSIMFAFAMKGVVDGAIESNGHKLTVYAIAIVSIVVLQFVFRVLINGLTEHVRCKLEMSYRAHLFENILNKKHEKLNGYHSGELMNRLTSDVSVVSDGITSILPTIVASISRLACAVVALVMLDWIFAVAFSIAGILVFIVLAVLRGKLKTLHTKSQETDGKVRSFMQECIENLLAVKVFSVNDKISQQSDELQEENFRIKMKRKNYSVLGNATYNFIFSAGFLFALIYGGIKLLSNPNFYGSLTAILQLVNNVQVPFMSLSNLFPKYYAMVASAERLMEIEDIENEANIIDRDRKEIYSSMKGIALSNVQFSYDRDKVLENVNLYINKGDSVAIFGASGIGKSTLIKLMLGVYPISCGEIYVDGEEKIALDNSTRTLFAYVPQGNMLFSGTLRENVTFINRDAPEEKILNALETACASEFISLLPNGLETHVGENGVGLS